MKISDSEGLPLGLQGAPLYPAGGKSLPMPEAPGGDRTAAKEGMPGSEAPPIQMLVANLKTGKPNLSIANQLSLVEIVLLRDQNWV